MASAHLDAPFRHSSQHSNPNSHTEKPQSNMVSFMPISVFDTRFLTYVAYQYFHAQDLPWRVVVLQYAIRKLPHCLPNTAFGKIRLLTASFLTNSAKDGTGIKGIIQSMKDSKTWFTCGFSTSRCSIQTQ